MNPFPRGQLRGRALNALRPIVFVACAALAVGAGADPGPFEHRLIDEAPPKNPWIKVVGDFNRDGRLDVAVGGSGGPLVWYANPTWSRRVIAEGGYESVDGAAGDVDGDGDLDLVIGGVVWYENPLPGRDPGRGPWAAHRIGRNRTHDVEAADLDRDGRLDVVVRGQTGFGHKEGHRILLFRQAGPDRWASRELRCPEGEGLKLADLDGDGDPDVVIAGRWYENAGDVLNGPWAEHVITDRWAHGDAKVEVADFNRDGRPDVLLSPAEYKGGTYRVAWYEAPRDPRDGRWAEHVIVPEVETVVHALGAADLDGDGAADVVIARMHQGAAPHEVSVYRNDGTGRRWAQRVVSTRGSHNLVLADLDGDGAVDILGANHGGPYQPVEWWRNLRVGATRR
jgi:hypothetical protein